MKTLLRPLWVVVALAFVAGCSVFEEDKPVLTPARKLAGTWKSEIAIPVKYQTDFCSGVKEVVAQADWTITWIITADALDENKCRIEMRYTASNYKRATSSCGNTGSTGWIPAVSPNFFTGTISSTSLTFSSSAQGVTFNGSFTTDLLMGTYVSWSYGSGEFTDTNALKLVRQKN